IPFSLTPMVKNDIPEIEDFTRFYDFGKTLISYKDKKFYEYQVLFVDTNFFSFFTFNMIEGYVATLFTSPSSVVISKEIADKYFGDEFCVGKTLTLDNKIDVTVSGVYLDFYKQQSKSTLYGDIIMPFEIAQQLYGPIDNWDSNNSTGFVRLYKKANLKQVEDKMDLSRKKYFDASIKSPVRLYLFPTKGLVHEAPYIERYANYQPTTGYTIMLILGFLFLLVGVFNYVNLSTARYAERLKELGIRKVIGASKSQLIKQFLMESIIIALITYPVAILVFDLVTSFFASLSPYMPLITLWNNGKLLFASLVISLLTGLIAGLYPALVLSSFNSVKIFKGIFEQGKGKNRFRKILVVLQFSISIIFIVLTILCQKQSKFLVNADLGYNRDGIIRISLDAETKESYPIIKEKLENIPGILKITAAVSTPGNWQTKIKVIPEGTDPDNSLNVYYYGINYDFFEAMGVNILSGRSFQENYQDENNVIINQLFADRLGWELPIGKSVKIRETVYTIVGIVNNSYFDNTFWPMSPTIFYLEKDRLFSLLVKAENDSKIPIIIDQIRSLWSEISPNTLFNYTYLNEYFIQSNGDSVIIPKIFGMIGILAVLYSGIGLLALANYSVRQRRKEICIRKVMGASERVILLMLSKDFLKLVVIACVLALPIAYFASISFLNFAFSIHINPDINVMIMATAISLSVAIIAIIAQTLKAARTNPADSLKYE
ncbi:ABC transporter permease, partial [Bacteroidota bacterium]